jgi:hypothetical protein
MVNSADGEEVNPAAREGVNPAAREGWPFFIAPTDFSNV